MLTPKEILTKLKPCHYRYNDKLDLGDKIHFGFLAQDVKDAFGDEYAFVTKDKNSEYLMVNYTEFIAPMISIIKEQQIEIEKLKEEIERIKEGKSI